MDITGMPKENFEEREAVKAFYREHEKEGVGIACTASQATAVNGDITDSNVEVGAGRPAVVAIVVVRYVVGVPS